MDVLPLKTCRDVILGIKVLLPVAVLSFYHLFLLPCEYAFAENTAKQVVKELQTELLAVMKQADLLGYSGRYQRLSPIVTTSYDLPFMARVVVGRYWRQFNNEQKTTLVEMFRKLSIATHAARFDGYSGQRFQIRSEETHRKGRLLIKSVLIKSSGEEIELDYLLHQREKRWRIINVIADGVSDLSLKRSDYSNYIKKNGFDALIEKMNEKINQYAK
jgi:phospholipid transport system substrate-binding protein